MDNGERDERGKTKRAVLIKQDPVEFEWKGPFENWARGHVSRQFWRVRALFLDEEDALQECAVIFVRCCNKYRGKVTEPKHMMALFKQAVVNEWHTYATKDTRLRETPLPVEMTPVTFNGGELYARIESAPEEVRRVLYVLLTGPTDLVQMILSDLDEVKLHRRMKRLCGITRITRNLAAQVRGVLTT